MADAPETSEPLDQKPPARVVASSAAKRSTARKTAKKAAAKRAPAKKAAAKRAPAKKAAAKRAPAKKAAAKRAPAKKAAAKRAPAKKAAAKRPAATAAAARPAPTRPPAPATTGLDDQPLRANGERRVDRWAVCASITEELLNEMVLLMVGGGVALEPLDTSLSLPGMGDIDVQLELTVTGGTFQLRSEDGGRARLVITADGDVKTRAATYEGPVDQGPGPGAALGVPTPPAPIPLRVEALVFPFVEVHPDHTVSLGLDLAEAELVSLDADSSATTPDGVDPAAWAGILQMFSMLFSMMGHSLFATLGEHVGTIGTDLGPEVGSALVELGVDLGRADVNISSGVLSFGLAATDRVRGRAQPVPVAGRRIGVGLATSVVDHLTQKLLERVVGDLPLPFELHVDLGEQSVGGSVRQTRLLPEPFPDLRSSLRTEVRPRLVRGRLELSVQAAWIEMPSMFPSFFNTVSRRLGELVSMAPIRMQFPARVEVPLLPDVPDTIPLEIDELRVTSNGLGVLVAIA